MSRRNATRSVGAFNRCSRIDGKAMPWKSPCRSQSIARFQPVPFPLRYSAIAFSFASGTTLPADSTRPVYVGTLQMYVSPRSIGRTIMFRSSVGPDRTFLSGCFYDRLRLCVKRVISDFQQVAARNSPSGLISGEIDERRHYALMLPLKHQASNVRNGRRPDRHPRISNDRNTISKPSKVLCNRHVTAPSAMPPSHTDAILRYVPFSRLTTNHRQLIPPRRPP